MKRYHINVFWSDADKAWVADVPDLKSCSAFGDSPEEAVAEVKEAMAAWLEVARQEGHPIPEAIYRPAIYAVASPLQGTGTFLDARETEKSNLAVAYQKSGRAAYHDVYVVRHRSGWAVRRADAKHSSSVFESQVAAERAAREFVRIEGGGQVRVQTRSGKWRDAKSTVQGARPSKDRKGQSAQKSRD